MASKTLVHKQGLPKQGKIRVCKNKAGGNPVPKPTGSKKDNGKDKERAAATEALIKKNLDEHMKRFTKPDERKPRPVKILLQLYLVELKDGWWPENIWLWKQGINRAEMELLRKALIKQFGGKQ